MNGGLELLANVLNAVSIALAGRNNLHTWWTGILGCILFTAVFFGAKLYADATLQIFFIVTSAVGWWAWLHGSQKEAMPVRHVRPAVAAWLFAAAVAVAASYGWVLHRFTDAYAPFLDSVILAFSVLGQFLLMGRRYETWWCWLLVNTIAIPLYYSRGLHVTAILYAAFWLNACIALVQWRRLIKTA